ncbi:hypothetical protein [Methylobacterium sp. ID0610]|uniref:hypothetical protein n=1 Tax=Methylobacterium carpenticola TaxID=3344827 RepID=UPI003691422D
MLRITVAYAVGPDGRFDLDYYASAHAALVHRLYDPVGLKRFEIDRDPKTNDVAAHLVFAPSATLMDQLEAAAPELIADGPNFTDITPRMTIATIVHQS